MLQGRCYGRPVQSARRRPKRKNSHAFESKIEMSQAARSAWSTACKLETLPSRCAQIAAVLILAGTAAVAQEPATFKAQAPQLEERSQAEWINSKPLKLSQLRGQVVILHFWTFGCINCQHNYPTLKAWQKAFAKKGVTIIGVHTPETSAERNNQNVRKSAKKNGLTYPIVVDPEAQPGRLGAIGCGPRPTSSTRTASSATAGTGNLIGREPRAAAAMKKKIEQLLAEPASDATGSSQQ